MDETNPKYLDLKCAEEKLWNILQLIKTCKSGAIVYKLCGIPIYNIDWDLDAIIDEIIYFDKYINYNQFG
jgi:hypothetical protein